MCFGPPAARARRRSGWRKACGPRPDATRIALYVHYSPGGQVSDMVRRQLSLLAGSGFSIVFISMAARIPDDDWKAVRALCALVVQRENFGRDFGAWHDLMPEVAGRWADIDELMLVNDSVLGPITALEPVIETMRAGGDGSVRADRKPPGRPASAKLHAARPRPRRRRRI